MKKPTVIRSSSRGFGWSQDLPLDDAINLLKKPLGAEEEKRGGGVLVAEQLFFFFCELLDVFFLFWLIVLSLMIQAWWFSSVLFGY